KILLRDRRKNGACRRRDSSRTLHPALHAPRRWCRRRQRTNAGRATRTRADLIVSAPLPSTCRCTSATRNLQCERVTLHRSTPALARTVLPVAVCLRLRVDRERVQTCGSERCGLDRYRRNNEVCRKLACARGADITICLISDLPAASGGFA